jgi:hypothetical protein
MNNLITHALTNNISVGDRVKFKPLPIQLPTMVSHRYSVAYTYEIEGAIDLTAVYCVSSVDGYGNVELHGVTGYCDSVFVEKIS